MMPGPFKLQITAPGPDRPDREPSRLAADETGTNPGELHIVFRCCCEPSRLALQ